MAYREIPAGSVEIQTGLYLYEYERTIGGTTYTFRQLYSAEGYCFYWLSNPENYDEEGNLLPANQRKYATFKTCAISATLESINADNISVPVEDGYEILSGGNDTETE